MFGDDGDESVWDYPRPPLVVPSGSRITVAFGGRILADSTHTVRVLETSHPPVYYIPFDDVAADLVEATDGESWCEWQGHARYWSLRLGDRRSPKAGWSYPSPSPGFGALAGRVAFYPSRTDGCQIDGEPVTAQDGDFYGGWITARIHGPYKGGTGTAGW
jgi:uncharacterized protein (DUF427 family)